MKYPMTAHTKWWPFNTGDCLIEVTAWAGLTVYHFHENNTNYHRWEQRVINNYHSKGYCSYNHIYFQYINIFSDIFYITY